RGGDADQRVKRAARSGREPRRRIGRDQGACPHPLPPGATRQQARERGPFGVKLDLRRLRGLLDPPRLRGLHEPRRLGGRCDRQGLRISGEAASGARDGLGVGASRELRERAELSFQRADTRRGALLLLCRGACLLACCALLLAYGLLPPVCGRALLLAYGLLPLLCGRALLLAYGLLPLLRGRALLLAYGLLSLLRGPVL